MNTVDDKDVGMDGDGGGERLRSVASLARSALRLTALPRLPGAPPPAPRRRHFGGAGGGAGGGVGGAAGLRGGGGAGLGFRSD